MGTPKQLLPFSGTTLLNHVLHGLIGVPVNEIIVVLGSRAEQIRSSLIPAFRSSAGGYAIDVRIRTEVNSDFRSGMLSSIQCGLRSMKGQEGPIAIVLGDQPGIPPPMLRKLYEIQRKTPKSIVVPEIGGKRGHPIVFDFGYTDAILALGHDQTLRDVVDRNESHVTRVPVDCSEVLFDIDTPEEYSEALKRMEDRGYGIENGR